MLYGRASKLVPRGRSRLGVAGQGALSKLSAQRVRIPLFGGGADEPHLVARMRPPAVIGAVTSRARTFRLVGGTVWQHRCCWPDRARGKAIQTCIAPFLLRDRDGSLGANIGGYTAGTSSGHAKSPPRTTWAEMLQLGGSDPRT
jgi:hypothetical protein